MYAKKKSMSMKVIVLLLAVVLLIGCAVGSTVAYLMAQSSVVTNTFVAGNIGTLTLAETGADGNPTTSRSFTVTPGVNITKDPKVSFSGHNVDAYVFVQVDSNGWSSDTTRMNYSSVDENVTFSIASGWTLVEGTTNVYSKTVGANETLSDVSIIANDTIAVSADLTAGEMTANTSLTFKAFAIQQADGGANNDGKFTPAEAWDKIS